MNRRRLDSLFRLLSAPSVPGVPNTAARRQIAVLGVVLLQMSRICLGQTVGYSDPWTSYRSIAAAPLMPQGTTLPVGHLFPDATIPVCEQAVCVPDCQPCRGPCDESGRRWTLRVEPGFAWRSAPRPQSLFSAGGTGTGQVDASQIGFSVVPALDAGLLMHDPSHRMDLELRTSIVDLWSDATGQSLTGNVVQVTANPPLATSGPRNVVTAYASRFGSWEINARHHSQHTAGLTWVTGFRAIRLDERLSGRLTDPTGVLPDEIVQSSVRNRLYGFQVGGDFTACQDSNWCLRLLGRIGLYGNAGSQSGQLLSLATPAVAFPAWGDDSTLAVHCQTGVQARWRFGESSTLVAGYQVSVLDGVALASEQPGSTSFLTQSGFHSNGTLILHSLTAGVEWFF